MKLTRIHLMAACAASTFVATTAHAQVAMPPVELRGAGATTVGDVAVRSLNCVGNPGNHVAADLINNRDNKYGTNSGSLAAVEPGHYNPTTALPAFDCETQEIQPSFEGKYIGTGSGAGRQMWRTFTTSNLNGSASSINPFAGGAGNPSGWANLQFAFSEAPASVSDVTAYNTTANSVSNKAGAAIQVPFFVIPVAFAYNPAYGVKTIVGGQVDMKFNVKFPQTINGVVAGGLRLKRDIYCKIFNGEITNWNHLLIRQANGGQLLFDPTHDTAGRWSNEGAPIRLVGRADKSGGTDVFTRAMAAQCNGLVAVNKFAKAAESLPFDNTSTIDIRRLRSDSVYFPGASSSGFAGTVQSLGGLVWDRTSARVCKWDELNVATKLCDTTLAPGGVLTNALTPGLFMVADGSSGVADGINSTANNALRVSAINPNIKLNGKFGYVGADFVTPVPGRTLFAAALQQGNTVGSGAFVMPSSLNASLAFGSVLPPETTSSTGAWAPFVNGSTGDQRKLGSVDPYLPIDPSTNPQTPVTRANPLHWVALLYNPNVAITSTLASPSIGYPVTGSAFMLTYTCFKPANPLVPGRNAKRIGMVEYMGLMFGKITKDSTNGTVNANTFKGQGSANVGVIAQSNTAMPSQAWINAITETFLIKSNQAANSTTLGAQNLWIQDGYPVTATQVDTINHLNDKKSNPTCDAGFGA